MRKQTERVEKATAGRQAVEETQSKQQRHRVSLFAQSILETMVKVMVHLLKLAANRKINSFVSSATSVKTLPLLSVAVLRDMAKNNANLGGKLTSIKFSNYPTRLLALEIPDQLQCRTGEAQMFRP